MNKHAWKDIRENPIVVDFRSCSDADELHIILKNSFGFPEHYGENWSAFEDCLDDFFRSERTDRNVHILGFYTLSADLREYCSLMLEIIDDIQKRYPRAMFSIVS